MIATCPCVIALLLLLCIRHGEPARSKFDRRHLGTPSSSSSPSTDQSTDSDHGQQDSINDQIDNVDHNQDQDSWSPAADIDQGSAKSYEESIPQMPDDVRKWLKKPHIKRVVRRPASPYMDSSYKRATSLPPLPMPPHSYPYPAPSSPASSHENPYGDSYSGVLARWNNKINWTNPYFGSSAAASSEFPNYATGGYHSSYPDYQTSASDYGDHHHVSHYTPHVQYIPYPVSTCHEHGHHGKKKEIGYIWPLILLGLLFLPLLFGALLIPLVLVFFTNLIQLISLIMTGQQAAAGAAPGAAGRRRKKRDLHGTLVSIHPMILDQIEMIGHQLDDSLHEFLNSSWFKPSHHRSADDNDIDSDYSSID